MSQNDPYSTFSRRHADMQRAVVDHLYEQQRKRLETAMSFWSEYFRKQEQNQSSPGESK